MFVSFGPMLIAKHPLENEDRLGSLPIPISFFYGDYDWMLRSKAYDVIDKNPYKGSHSHIHIIS